jgi:hypothetical protein
MLDSNSDSIAALTAEEFHILGEVFCVRRNQLEILRHPLNAEKSLLHVDYKIPLNYASAVCTYLNSFFFETIECPSDRLVFQPTLKAFVGSGPLQSDLYVTFCPKDKERLLSFLAAHADEISYVLDNTSIAKAFRPNVTFSRARARLESGFYAFS